MSDLPKALHSAALSLTVLLTLGATLFAERRALRSDLLRAERSYLAHQLLTLPASRASPADIQTLYDGPTDQLDDAWATYLDASSEGEIAGLGALSLDLPWKLWRMAEIPGGRLYYRTDALSTEEHGLVEESLLSYEPCEDVAAARPYFLVVDIDESPPNNLVGDAPRLLVSNYEISYQPKEQWYCWRLGAARVVLLGSGIGSVARGSTAAQLAEEVINISQGWGEVREDPVDAFRDLRSRYGSIEGESPRIEIPFVSISIPVRWATTALALAGLALISWTSQLLWQIAGTGGPSLESFWLGTSSILRLRRRGFDSVLASFELVSVIPALGFLLFSPALIAAMALADTWNGGPVALRMLLAVVLLACLVLSIGAIRTAIAILRLRFAMAKEE